MTNSTSSAPVTTQVLDEVNTSLKRARTCTGEFTNLLRKAYQQDESYLALGTLKYRRRLYSEGVMYGKHVYPRSLALVKDVKDIVENYTLIGFEDFANYVDDIRQECLENSKKAKQSQLAHTFVLANLKTLENEMRQELNVHRNRGVSLRNNAVVSREKAVTTQNIGLGAMAASTTVGPLVGLLFAPFDGGLTTLAFAALGAGATMAGNHINAKAAKQDNEVKSAYENATALGHLIQSVESITEAVDIVAQFMALLANELSGIGGIGVGKTFKEMHWKKMTNKAKILVESCNNFIAVEPAITADMLSIKEDLEHGYSEAWKTNFKVYADKLTIE
jgi:hypothetical protein